MECLKIVQAITDTTRTSFLNRDDPSRRQKKWIKYDERLDRVINAYDDYRDVMVFFGCCSQPDISVVRLYLQLVISYFIIYF